MSKMRFELCNPLMHRTGCMIQWCIHLHLFWCSCSRSPSWVERRIKIFFWNDSDHLDWLEQRGRAWDPIGTHPLCFDGVSANIQLPPTYNVANIGVSQSRSHSHRERYDKDKKGQKYSVYWGTTISISITKTEATFLYPSLRWSDSDLWCPGPVLEPG